MGNFWLKVKMTELGKWILSYHQLYLSFTLLKCDYSNISEWVLSFTIPFVLLTEISWLFLTEFKKASIPSPMELNSALKSSYETFTKQSISMNISALKTGLLPNLSMSMATEATITTPAISRWRYTPLTFL